MQYCEIELVPFKDQLNKLKRCQFQVNAYENVLKFLARTIKNDNADYFLSNYTKFMEDYAIALMDFEDCKNESLKIFLSNYDYKYFSNNWNIDYNNELLKINLELNNNV